MPVTTVVSYPPDGKTVKETWTTPANTYVKTVDGVQTESRAMTAAEIQQATVVEAANVTASNQSAIQTNLEQDQIAMQAIIDATNATINSNPAPHLKAIARNLKRLNRTVLKDYTGTD